MLKFWITLTTFSNVNLYTFLRPTILMSSVRVSFKGFVLCACKETAEIKGEFSCWKSWVSVKLVIFQLAGRLVTTVQLESHCPGQRSKSETLWYKLAEEIKASGRRGFFGGGLKQKTWKTKCTLRLSWTWWKDHPQESLPIVTAQKGMSSSHICIYFMFLLESWYDLALVSAG